MISYPQIWSGSESVSTIFGFHHTRLKMQKPHFRSLFFFGLLSLLSLHSTAQSHSIAQCDSLIANGITAYKKGQHTRSVEVLVRAREWAKKSNWPKQEFLALNNIGANYHQLCEYGESINYYLEAYTIAIRKLEPSNEMTALNNIAVLYSEEEKYEEAQEYFSRAYLLSKKNNDPVKIGMYANNLGNIAIETNHVKEARSYFNEAVPLLRKRPELLIHAELGIANCHLLEGNLKLARKESRRLLANGKHLEFNRIDIKLLMLVTRTYLKENKFEQALRSAKEALERQPDLESKIELFRLATEIYIQSKAFDKALQYKDSVFEATARLNEIRNGRLYENSKIKFELLNYKNKAALNEARLSGEQNKFYLILSLSGTLVIFVIWFLRNRAIEYEQIRIIAERNEQILMLELEKERNTALLLEKQMNENQVYALAEQQRLQGELELKNRKLSTKALYLSGKNQMIEEIVRELNGLPQVRKNNQVAAHIQSLRDQLKQDNEWDNFVTHFEEIHHGFLQTLRSQHPDLTVSDIRYLCYIYMNLSTKEIASLLHITPDSCRKRKERILCKLGLTKDDNLYDYLYSI